MDKIRSRILFFLAILLLAACGRRSPVYRVALQSLPERIDPRTNMVNIYHYINIHLFYPLFEREDDGSLSSQYLDLNSSIALDKSFKHFQLCLRPGAAFSAGDPIENSDLKTSIETTHEQDVFLPRLSEISIDKGCVMIALTEKDPIYFDHLTTIRSAVVRFRKQDDPVPIGLGPYQVKEFSKDRILLTASPGRVRGSFKSVEFLRFSETIMTPANNIHDFNHLYHFPPSGQNTKCQTSKAIYRMFSQKKIYR
ncbi:MAG: hypothetical protein HY747_00420 [Elusimicrobia bacterium]|nr:hypothetical protein [Elusimicrobiota bacterium]